MDGQKASKCPFSHDRVWSLEGNLCPIFIFSEYCIFMYYFAFMDWAAKELLGIMARENIEGYAKN